MNGPAVSTDMVKRATVLSARELSWHVGGFTIIDGVDLDVREGEFLSVIGPNGAGKSTLVNLLSGAVRPTAGSILLKDDDVTKLRAAHRVRRGIARTFQTSSLFEGLSVLENARLAAQANIRGSMNIFKAPSTNDGATSQARECLERVGLGRRAVDQVSDLPYGDKRKLEIALVLCSQPSVLLLDEPTAGVSAEDIDSMVDVVRAVHDSGTTVIMVEHRMDLVIDVSDRVAVMQSGQLLVCDIPAVVMADERVQAAYLGPEL
ncbi:branched-chain amino acid transport system ATP-binding protein [Arthrobacter sp. V1I7]|nr:branched-chain amino acid transport system ATP-binding protein [Arthrobacter sp. V1I7]